MALSGSLPRNRRRGGDAGSGANADGGNAAASGNASGSDSAAGAGAEWSAALETVFPLTPRGAAD